MVIFPRDRSKIGSCNSEASPAAAATFASVVNEGPTGGPCAKIITTTTGQADWDVQIFQTGTLNIVQGNYYKLTFQAMANG